MGFLRDLFFENSPPQYTIEVELNWLPSIMAQAVAKDLALALARHSSREVLLIFREQLVKSLGRNKAPFIPVKTGEREYLLTYSRGIFSTRARPEALIKLVEGGQPFELYYGKSSEPRAVRARRIFPGRILCETREGYRNFQLDKIRAANDVPTAGNFIDGGLLRLRSWTDHLTVSWSNGFSAGSYEENRREVRYGF